MDLRQHNLCVFGDKRVVLSVSVPHVAIVPLFALRLESRIVLISEYDLLGVTVVSGDPLEEVLGSAEDS